MHGKAPVVAKSGECFLGRDVDSATMVSLINT
jgi:hypothetical protein